MAGRHPTHDDPTPPTGRPGEEREAAPEALRTCPNCGRSLVERSCKLIRFDPACGYFLWCADYL